MTPLSEANFSPCQKAGHQTNIVAVTKLVIEKNVSEMSLTTRKAKENTKEAKAKAENTKEAKAKARAPPDLILRHLDFMEDIHVQQLERAYATITTSTDARVPLRVPVATKACTFVASVKAVIIISRTARKGSDVMS